MNTRFRSDFAADRAGPLFGGPRMLWLLCIGGALAEAAILQALGFDSALPLAPQLSAPAPFGVFHDLRWVWTYAWSWSSALWQLIALWAFRALFDALLIAAAWPADAPRPRLATLWRRSVGYTAAAVVVMSPWATLTFAAGAVSYGWFLLGAIAASLLTALVMPPGVITGEWWRRIVPWRTMPHILVAWLAIMGSALAMTFSPAWVTLLVAAGGGTINALLWRRIVASVVAAGAPRYTVPVTPIAVVVVIGAFIAGGGYLYGNSHGSGRSQELHSAAHLAHAPSPSGPASAQPVIFVNGFASHYDGRRYGLLGPGIRTWYYSYNGLDASGRPRAYGPEDTYQSLRVSARLLALQVDRLHAVSGRPVAIVAESEGTMVARMYFERAAHPPVDRYIQTSPLVRPSRVYYPSAGQQDYGWLGGWEAREILHLVRLESPAFKAGADIPFLRSMVEQAPRLRDQTLCPLPGIQTFMFVPLQAAMMAGRGPLARIPWVALPGWHATLLRRGTVQQDVRQLLSTGVLRHRPGWRFAFQLIRGAAAAWQSPALPLRLRAAWQAKPGSDPAFGGYDCQTARFARPQAGQPS